MSKLNITPNVVIRMGDDRSLYKNNVVQTGLDWILDLIANISNTNLTHIAIGDNNTSVSLGDIRLGNELYRKSITNMFRDTGTLVVESFFDTNEANFVWQEIGLFANGTGDKDSGVLVARAVINENKDNLRTATISWDIGLVNI